MTGYFVAFLAGAITTFAARVWYVGRRRARTAPRDSGATYQQRIGERGTPGRGVRASLLESVRDPANPNDVTESNERELADDLRGYLGDIGAQHGADDVMFWMRRDDATPFVGIAWNHKGAPPRGPWGSESQRILVAWAAAEGVVTFDAGDGAPSIAAARVSLDDVATLPADGATAGAIVLHCAAGIRSSRAEIKLWLPRHAERLTQFVEMQLTKNESARQNRRMRALVRSSQRFSATTTREELERMVTDDVLDASGATFAALVEWHADETSGVVRSATELYPGPAPSAGSPVIAASMVGAACVEGVPKHYTETAALVGDGQLFSATQLFPVCGALTIQPMRRGTTIIGAIVIGKQEAGAMRRTDLGTTALFAQLAGSALEGSWEIEEVKSTARIDQLTGLPNRRHFDDELKRTLDQTDRIGGSCALVLADVDHFKIVNDTYGHEAGDQVLKAIAEVMRKEVRSTEAAARIGGEEFCIVLQQTGKEGAVELAGRLRAKVEALAVRFRDRDLRVTWSFGVATYDAGGGPLKRSQLFEAADRALYRAKGEGRNCVRTA